MSDKVKKVAFSPYSDIDTETILIGENCLTETATKLLGNKKPLIVSLYKNYSDVRKASDYCWDNALILCKELSISLNETHGVSYSLHYWQTLLLPWIVAWVENLYDRYLRLSWVRDNYPDAVLEVPRIDTNAPIYLASGDVWGKSHLHHVNCQLYNLLIDHMGLSGRTEFLDVDFSPLSTGSYPLIEHCKKLIERPLFFLNACSVFEKIGVDCVEFGIESIKDSDFKSQQLRRNITSPDNFCRDEFHRLLRFLTPLAFPSSLHEEYIARSEYARYLIKDKNIRTLCISSTFWGNDTIKYVMAEMREVGLRLVGRQHGAGYGNYEHNIVEQVERFLTSTYITWGWTDGRESKTLALPDPRLSELIDVHCAGTEDILFISTQAPMYLFRYQSYWIPEFVHEKYFAMQEKFISHLSKPLRSRIVYRSHPIEYGWNEKQRVVKLLPEVRFDSTRHCVNSMKHKYLTVIDHPGTSVMEALVMNVPLIAYWDFSQIPMREEAQTYFSLLEEVGILHNGPEQAAKHLNTVIVDLNSWWNGDHIQNARKEFCGRFALADKNWKLIWKKEFSRS